MGAAGQGAEDGSKIQEGGVSVARDQAAIGVVRVLGVKMESVLHTLAAGVRHDVAMAALMSSAGFLTTQWAEPGMEAKLLVAFSDYLLEMSAEYPPAKPQ